MILAVIIFDFTLIRRTPGIALKIRSLGGLIGVSIAVIVIFLDLDLGGLIHLTPVSQIKSLDIWLSLISTFLIGFLFLLIVDFLIRRGVIPFVIMFTTASSIISPYYLISLSQVRELSSLGIIGFATGWITYFSFSSLRYPTYSFATDSEPTQIQKREQRVSDQLSEIQAKKIELVQRMNRTQIEILESKINMLDQAFEIISKEYSSKLTQDFPKHLEELKEFAKTLPANELSAKINDFIGGMNPSLEALPETLAELRTQLLFRLN